LPPGRGQLGSRDHRNATANQVGHQSRDAIELPIQPMVLDRDVMALDVAGLLKARAERG
jgi:hypothetical protein